MRKINLGWHVFFFILSGALIIRPAYSADVVDRIVAIVNDEVITQSELEESMLPFVADYRVRYGEKELEYKMDEARSDALNRLIEEKLILLEAEKRKITVDEDEITERLKNVKARFQSEEEFEKMLRNSGVTLARLRRRYKDQIMMRKLVNGIITHNVHISPTQIAAFYNGHKEEFTEPPKIRFKVLLLKPLPDRNMEETEALAHKILDRMKSGENFDALVKEYSQGPNIDKGGDMGFMPKGSIIKDIEDAIGVLGPGEISPLIKTGSGFNIVKLIEKKKAAVKPLSDLTSLIRERLFQREAELTLREFVNKLKEDAYIKIN